MTYVPKTSKRIYTNASAILLLFATYGCDQPPSPGLPQGAKAGILLMKDNNLSVVDGTGEPVPRCQLCTKDLQETYGPKCERATGISPPICRSVTGGIVEDIDCISVVTSSQSPGTCTICKYISGEKVCWQVKC